MKLILFRGIPGSSKSTSANRMFPGILKLEQDQYFMRDGHYRWNAREMPKAVAWCKNACRNALENNFDVIVCNTFTKQKYIKDYEDLAKEYGADFVVYRCNGQFKNTHNVPRSVLASMKAGFEDWDGEINI